MTYETTKKRISQAAIRSKKLTQVLEACLDAKLFTLEAHYPIYRGFESMLYSYGTAIQDLENEKKRATPDYTFDLSKLSFNERDALSTYISQYCNNDFVGNYSFERFKDGYRAILPYLLSRKVDKGKNFSIKQKYIANVFDSLLNANIGIIHRMIDATIIIVSCSPHNENFVRDNDNADSRDIINLIKTYVLDIDDSGNHLNLVYDTRDSDSFFTEVYILPKISFDTLIL